MSSKRDGVQSGTQNNEKIWLGPNTDGLTSGAIFIVNGLISGTLLKYCTFINRSHLALPESMESDDTWRSTNGHFPSTTSPDCKFIFQGSLNVSISWLSGSTASV